MCQSSKWGRIENQHTKSRSLPEPSTTGADNNSTSYKTGQEIWFWKIPSANTKAPKLFQAVNSLTENKITGFGVGVNQSGIYQNWVCNNCSSCKPSKGYKPTRCQLVSLPVNYIQSWFLKLTNYRFSYADIKQATVKLETPTNTCKKLYMKTYYQIYKCFFKWNLVTIHTYKHTQTIWHEEKGLSFRIILKL